MFGFRRWMLDVGRLLQSSMLNDVHVIHFYIEFMTAESLVVSDPEILGGTPVFKGTRVPVRTLFEYLADGLSLEYFLETFPSVTREQAADVLRLGQERIEREVAA
jgi:uncharacterized protein (DUF433 family)